MATVIYEDQALIVKSWLLDLPGHHPIWRHYILGIFSLRDEVDTPTAIKQFPEATHEFCVYVLNPEAKPVPHDPATHVPLMPINYVHQVKTDDGTAKRIGGVLVDHFEAGRLFGEPSGIQGMRGLFAGIIDDEVRRHVTDERSQTS